jgi:hypothetical protein
MSTAGILPGNDPSVHLTKSKQIIIDEKVSYSEISWYPPFFHTILAIIQIFAGTTDALTAAFILKILIAAFNILLVLSTYLLTRKFFGIGTAVVSALFTIISVPIFEMIYWGGYANFMGLAYVAFIFYLMNKDLGVKVKTLLLFLGTFTLILIHQLTAFVFVLIFFPIFLINSTGSKRKFTTFLAVIVGGSLALLAWYARIIIGGANMIIDYIFYTVGENFYHIPAVSIQALTKSHGITLYVMLAGITIMFIMKNKKTSLRDLMLIIFWLVVPFIFAESYLFGLNLPYHRFVYFFSTPIAILCGVTIYFGASKIPEFFKSKIFPKVTKNLKSKIFPKVTKNLKSIYVFKVFILLLVFSLFVVQTYTFVQQIETYPDFYKRATISTYNSGLWIKQHSGLNGTVITSRSPGSWFQVFSDHRTIQETDPLSSRSVVAESVLYSFFEIEKSQTITREYAPVSPSSGQGIDALRFNLWTEVFSIPNEKVYFIYVNPIGEWITIPLSATSITSYWTHNSSQPEVQLITEYLHRLFTIKKTVTVPSNSSLININWYVQTNQDLNGAKLEISTFFDPSLNFTSGFFPGILEWQNPWDNPTKIDKKGEWAIVEGTDLLTNEVAAILDEKNGFIVGFEFNEKPDWSNLGALKDRRIDALRLRYDLSYSNEWKNDEISFSLFVHSFELEEVKKWTYLELIQKLNEFQDFTVKTADYLTYIQEYNIKFVAIDTQQVVSNIEATPALDKIYDDGRMEIYATKK